MFILSFENRQGKVVEYGSEEMERLVKLARALSAARLIESHSIRLAGNVDRPAGECGDFWELASE